MTNAERGQFALRIVTLASAFRCEVDEPAIEGYWLGLRDMPISALDKAIEGLIKNGDRMPTAGEVRAAAVQVRKELIRRKEQLQLPASRPVSRERALELVEQIRERARLPARTAAGRGLEKL